MSIASDLRTYLLTKTNLATIFEDAFGLEQNAVMIRSDPSTANVIEYVDGSYTGTQQLSIYARNVNPATAQADLEKVRATVDKKEITLTGVGVLKVQAVSTVSFVNKEETGEFIYSTTVDVTFGGNNPIGV